MPRFSIILPFRNDAAALPAMLEALGAQTDRDWQAFLIDDRSVDEGPALVEEAAFADPRLHLLDNPGAGPAAACNHGGLDLAAGDLLIFADIADRWEPERLALLRALFSDPCVDALAWCGEGAIAQLALRRKLFACHGGFPESPVLGGGAAWLAAMADAGARILRISPLRAAPAPLDAAEPRAAAAARRRRPSPRPGGVAGGMRPFRRRGQVR